MRQRLLATRSGLATGRAAVRVGGCQRSRKLLQACRIRNRALLKRWLGLLDLRGRVVEEDWQR